MNYMTVTLVSFVLTKYLHRFGYNTDTIHGQKDIYSQSQSAHVYSQLKAFSSLRNIAGNFQKRAVRPAPADKAPLSVLEKTNAVVLKSVVQLGRKTCKVLSLAVADTDFSPFRGAISTCRLGSTYIKTTMNTVRKTVLFVLTNNNVISTLGVRNVSKFLEPKCKTF